MFGVPTRAQTGVAGGQTGVLDGLFGRSDKRIVLQRKRNKAPGWDGCRDRNDGRQEPFPQKLLWEKPLQRSSHRSVYAADKGIMLVLGGLGYPDPVLKRTDSTFNNDVMGDFWQYNIHACPSNCSDNGLCKYGYCFCHDGYYGLDCSNVTCPGDRCWYDEFTNEQHCRHCCHSPFVHTDINISLDEHAAYLPDQRKVSEGRGWERGQGRGNGWSFNHGGIALLYGLQLYLYSHPRSCEWMAWSLSLSCPFFSSLLFPPSLSSISSRFRVTPTMRV